jgi:hypothetical protein
MDLNGAQLEPNSKFHFAPFFLSFSTNQYHSLAMLVVLQIINVFESCALNPKFQHFIPILFYNSELRA